MNIDVNTEVILTLALEVHVRDEYEDHKLGCENDTVSHTTDECAWNG